ncbi:MAG: hypothetical protein KDA41_20200 [Planctomycetales bacterium]|nr:hypothetical protein [Planctomycetales bacterium]
MNPRQREEPSKPRVALRRRPSDFAKRGVILLQPGCCCCCCCCLHWIGAAGGAIWGTVAGCRAGAKAASEAEALARRYVYWGSLFGALFWAPLLVATGIAAMNSHFGEAIHFGLLVGLAFAPSIAVLTVGGGAMLGAWHGSAAASRKAGSYEESGGANAWALAWRISWKTFLYSTFGSGLGYLAMYLLYVIGEIIY